MKICSYTFEEFVARVQGFHGFAAPGVIIGGFMVDLAQRNLPPDILFDALCETPKCLPDAVQLLTPCTVGNSWLTVINIGRYAMALYDKSTGVGKRVFVDSGKIENWPELKSWFFKLKPKKDQDDGRLMKEIREAGSSIFSMQQVKVAEHFVKRRRRGGFAICSRCREGYPEDDGPFCRACQGQEHLYEAPHYP